jgi:TrmH family RNA methyltransferase
MKTLNSTQNEEVKSICKLIHPKERRDKKRFIVEGIRTISTFLEAGHKAVQLYVLEHAREEAKKMIDERWITVVNESVMNKISQTTTSSGMLAIFRIPPSPDVKNLTDGIVLASLTDPGNVGTLVRTAAAMNKKSVVVIDGVDIWSPKVVQASAGSLAHVSIFSWTWEQLLQNKGDKKLCALVVSGGEKPTHELLKNSLLIIGSEAHGIPQEWLPQCDERISLPMPGGIESLNAAVAGSIALYLASV